MVNAQIQDQIGSGKQALKAIASDESSWQGHIHALFVAARTAYATKKTAYGCALKGSRYDSMTKTSHYDNPI